MFKSVARIGLISILLSMLPLGQLAANGCPGVDLTGCCPPDPAFQHTSCTIFGCHTCSGTGCNESCANGCQQSCIPRTFQPCYQPRKIKCKIHKKKPKRVVKAQTVVKTVVEELPCCKEPVLCVAPCAPLPCVIVKCKVIFPGDIQETLCHDFKKKLHTCEADSCFSAYVQDPTLKTTWKIIGKKGNRCVISSTSEDVGLLDDNRNPIPMTQTCEYDKIGINALIKRFNDMVKGYYHFTTCERGVGIHNCSITSNDKPIQKARRNWY